jgi:N-glycosylase/DNA lyase
LEILNNIIKKINKIKKDSIINLIDKRIKEFEKINKKSTKEWFSELCFCLLTANWQAKKSIDIQNKLKYKGFCSTEKNKLYEFLKEQGHRFYPQRTEYIVLAREHKNIKSVLNGMDDFTAREWIAQNIKGLGYKESSHFLRNVGYKNLAIIDRHIINLLFENNLIENNNLSLTKKRYLEYENILDSISKKVNLNQAKLDLVLWYIKTGQVLK